LESSSAAVVDPEIGAELAAGHARRHRDAQSVSNLVADEGTHIRARRRAADVLFTVHSYEVYELLVRTRGWSRLRWEQWARDNVARELVADTDQPVETQREGR